MNMRSWNRIVNAINWLLNQRVLSKNMRLQKTPGGPVFLDTSGSVAVDLPAIAQEDSADCPDEYISVKLADESLTAYGDAFDVIAAFTDGASTIAECVPDITASSLVWVRKVGDAWILRSPTLTQSTDCA